MISSRLARRSQQLAAEGEPFATATVVRVQHPTSVEPGSVALILADGTIEGFVGGVCAEQSVKAYSLIALESGEPVLLRILPDADADIGEGPEGGEPTPEQVAAAGREIEDGEEGAVTVRNPCLSGGAIEVFIEPSPPAPRLLVVGDSPTVAALRRIAPEVGLEVVVGEDEDVEPVAGDLALVVAAHGRDELGPLRRGLEADLPFIGLVASERRGSAVLAELRQEGVEEERLARIEVPAGIPIGSHDPAEIAVSILARIIAVRRSGEGGGGTGRPGRGAAAVAVDPICGMTVAAVAGTPSLERDGETIYFCGEGCKAAFEEREEHAHAAG